ncbi:hypothetical protein TNCV_838691 [Trichonephila clavipes]|nr:hypothetical protein TNCV_838691 [Trichonephila clavipes]
MTSLVGLALDSATSSGLGRAPPPALQCRTPSRHHLELQDRWDYTPADRAARTCWLGCPGLLCPRPHLTSPKILRSSKPRSKCQFSQGAESVVSSYQK